MTFITRQYTIMCTYVKYTLFIMSCEGPLMIDGFFRGIREDTNEGARYPLVGHPTFRNIRPAAEAQEILETLLWCR